MKKYWVTKGQLEYIVITDSFDKIAGNTYENVKGGFVTEAQAQVHADKLNKEHILEQMKSIKKDDDILDGFTCLGSIDKVYPTLPQEVLDCYRTWIFEWEDKSFRMAIWDLGNSHCSFICEGTEAELIKHLPEQKELNRKSYYEI